MSEPHPQPGPDEEHGQDEHGQDDADVKDVDMDPEDHVNRPDQPDFDPAERRPFDDPDTPLPTETS